MNNFYITDYIKNDFNLDREVIDLLKYEIDKTIYYYGDNFKNPSERYQKKLKTNFKKKIKKYLITIKENLSSNKIILDTFIISNTYFRFNNELSNLGYNFYLPPWSEISFKDQLYKPFYNQQLINYVEQIKDKFQTNNFNDFIEKDFINEINYLRTLFTDFFKQNNITSLVVPYDLPFFEKMTIDIFKEINKPSFIALHGLPGRYNNIDDNRADYLIVWGESIKENYIRSGVNKNKIFVSGHPYYKKISKKIKEISLDNILVLTNPIINGAPFSHSQDGLIYDRGRLIWYLYSVQNVLKKLGVKHVRFRPHPSENINWYLKYIDNDFYQYDSDNLVESLNKSSFVIGATSTVFLESIYHGTNYIIYEPVIDGRNIVNFGLKTDIDYQLVPPFDGSDSRILTARNENELFDIIKNKERVDTSFFNEYIQENFNIDFIKDIVK